MGYIFIYKNLNINLS